ncbi:MAG: hypothetical protein F4Y38_10200 [Gemmatimonadetes bacterium]|nr:hypothetical protein [Gemmatimonadota bacterium]MYG86674.1 hypothetical protein [Gemmatimonadota bacterium]MYJ88777.1 hypothetical protein [Gemmatimonadota bacterium]
MKKIVLILLATAVSLSATGKGFAQVPEKRMSISLGGGRSIPSGGFADGKTRGSLFLLGMTVRVSESVHLAFNGYDNLFSVKRGQHDRDRLSDDALQRLGPHVDANVSLEGANFGLMYKTSTSPAAVYGLGGIGYSRAIDRFFGTVRGTKLTAFSTETSFSILIGGGVHVPMTSTVGLALDVRYIRAFNDRNIQWMPVALSIVFSFWKVEPG